MNNDAVLIPFTHNTHKAITNIFVLDEKDKEYLGIKNKSNVMNIYKLKIYGLDDNNLTIMITHDKFRKHTESDSHYFCFIYAVKNGFIAQKLGIYESERDDVDISTLGKGFIRFFHYYIDNKVSLVNLKPSLLGYLNQLTDRGNSYRDKNRANIMSINNIIHKSSMYSAELSTRYTKLLSYINTRTLDREKLEGVYNYCKIGNESIYSFLNRALMEYFPFIRAIEKFESNNDALFAIKAYAETKEEMSNDPDTKPPPDDMSVAKPSLAEPVMSATKQPVTEPSAAELGDEPSVTELGDEPSATEPSAAEFGDEPSATEPSAAELGDEPSATEPSLAEPATPAAEPSLAEPATPAAEPSATELQPTKKVDPSLQHSSSKIRLKSKTLQVKTSSAEDNRKS